MSVHVNAPRELRASRAISNMAWYITITHMNFTDMDDFRELEHEKTERQNE